MQIQGAEKMLGLSELELIEHTLFEFVVLEDHNQFLDGIDSGRRNIESGNLIRKDGKMLNIEIEGSVRVVSEQTVYTLNLRDISDRLKYEKEITEAKIKAEQTRDELQEKVTQIEAFNRVAIDRELRMIELKRTINQLSAELDKEPPFLKVKTPEVGAKLSE